MKPGRTGTPASPIGQIAECPARLAADDQPGDSPLDDRRAEPAAFRQLSDDRIRNDTRRRRRSGSGRRAPLPVPGLERPLDNFSPVCARAAASSADAFERHHVEPDLRQAPPRNSRCRRRPRARAGRDGHHLGQQLAEHRRRRQEPAAAHRHPAIDIGQRPRLGGQEIARAQSRPSPRARRDRSRPADEAGSRPSPRERRRNRGPEHGRSSLLYADNTLEVQELLSAAAAAGQPPFIRWQVRQPSSVECATAPRG